MPVITKTDEDGVETKVAQCDSCAIAVINGVVCHEIGCPDAWMDYIKECKECGDDFKPEFSCQAWCNNCLDKEE